ncbi:MAG: hypothetical protein ACOCX1_05645 [Fimbriimonadaceae bacterium]
MKNLSYGGVLLACSLALVACEEPESTTSTRERGETLPRAEADLNAIPTLPDHYVVLYTSEACDGCAETEALLEELSPELDELGAVTVEYDLSAEQHPEIDGLGITDLVDADAEAGTATVISASSEQEVARFGPETTLEEARAALALELPAF